MYLPWINCHQEKYVSVLGMFMIPACSIHSCTVIAYISHVGAFNGIPNAGIEDHEDIDFPKVLDNAIADVGSGAPGLNTLI